MVKSCLYLFYLEVLDVHITFITFGQSASNFWIAQTFPQIDLRMMDSQCVSAADSTSEFWFFQGFLVFVAFWRGFPQSMIGDRNGATKKLCDKDFTEGSGKLSGPISLKTLVVLGNDR